jgi:predicted ABC-type ATPase
MSIKRMRVFAGPNGSGKTTIFKGILKDSNINLGVYVNADEIEVILNDSSPLDFGLFQIQVSNEQLRVFFKRSTFSPTKRKESDLYTKLFVNDNLLTIKTFVDSYLAADLAEFVRQQLVDQGLSFTYETVMSFPDKIKFLEESRRKGYKVYLYFIATNDPEININRVNLRVAQNGHYVDPDVISRRYFRSLKNLKFAIKQTDRAYVFDNTGTSAKLVAEITNGINVIMNSAIETPSWVIDSLI